MTVPVTANLVLEGPGAGGGPRATVYSSLRTIVTDLRPPAPCSIPHPWSAP